MANQQRNLPPRKPTKKEKREAGRQARIDTQRRRRKAKQRNRIIGAVVAVIAIIGIVGAILTSYKPPAPPEDVAKHIQTAGCGDIQEFPMEGREHEQPGDPPTVYKTNPPTSGKHYPTPANWGYNADPLPDDVLVHNLEHGGVWISYKGISKAEIGILKDVADRHLNGVIVTPRATDDENVAMAAWQHSRKCKKVDAVVIDDYIKKFCGKGPEQVGTTC
jgi:uncharacterized protein DUF3105